LARRRRIQRRAGSFEVVLQLRAGNSGRPEMPLRAGRPGQS
jgi:hypothetical protein